MVRSLLLCLSVVLCQVLPLSGADDVTGEPLRLTLPPVAYAVAASEMSVYFDNIVLAEKSDDLRFEVTAKFGKNENRRWTTVPTDAQVGQHHWHVGVHRENQLVAQGEMVWHVSPAKVKQPKEVTLFIVGDSLTHATTYPNELAKRLEASGVKLTMLGTHRPSNAAPGVAHEGYGGWTWQRFVKHYDANPDLERKLQSSPFVFRDAETTMLDVARYFRESCQDRRPDYIVVLLGANDCFGADANSVAKMDETIDAMFANADTLLKAFHATAPNAKVGVCLQPPGNVREEAFQNNYKGRYSRWGWKRIQHRLVEREIKQFGGTEPLYKFVEMIPTELNVDPVDGFPVDNAVHPNTAGYQQIAASIHAWLMSRLTEKE